MYNSGLSSHITLAESTLGSIILPASLPDRRHPSVRPPALQVSAGTPHNISAARRFLKKVMGRRRRCSLSRRTVKAVIRLVCGLEK